MIVRVRFSKLGRVRWTSHRDVARMWERALRRARLALSYTNGFSPRPRLSFGLALPTGCESRAEYLDVVLAHDMEPDQLWRMVATSLPAGIEVMATGVPEEGQGSLQQDVTSCSWEISVPSAQRRDLEGAVSKVLGAQSLPVERERKGRRVPDDLRPSVLDLYVSSDDDSDARMGTLSADAPAATLVADLATRPRGVRPAELARVMGVEFGIARRTRQWIERDGSRFEPLQARTAPSACAEEIAS